MLFWLTLLQRSAEALTYFMGYIV